MKRLATKLCLGLWLLSAVASAQELPSVFTYPIGNCTLSLLCESQQKANPGILIGASEEILKTYAPEGTFPNAMNAFLLQTPDKNILFDTGMGRKLFDNLATLGVAAEKIDIVVITHMHGDHIGGMLKGDAKAFPNADVYLPQPEYDYWTNPEIIAQTPENRRGGFHNAIRVIETYKDRLHLFVPDRLGEKAQPILPGIQGIAAYGHTPGHTVFLVEAEKQKLLIWGDLTHAMAIQMPHPEVAVTYDVHPEDAIRARREILEYIEKYRIPVAGMHIPFPGMGQIKKAEGTGYNFIPFQ